MKYLYVRSSQRRVVREVVMEVKILSFHASCCLSENVCKECSQHFKMEAVV